MIPLIDLKAQYQALKPEIDAAIQGILDSANFIGGAPVAEFERAWAEYCEAKAAVGVANGTAALHLALCESGIKPGEEVVTVSHTFIATAEVARQCGASVRMVDIDRETYCMDPRALEHAISPRTRVVIPVHLYGHPAPMDEIAAICKQHNLFLIEDAAQAHGARYKGHRVGSIASIATFSFYPGKNLGAYGDAGGITTDDPAAADRIAQLANHGRDVKYTHKVEGFNYRLDALQAAVLRVKLRHLEEWNRKRREIASLYTKLLGGVSEVGTPRVASYAEPVFHLYVVQVPDRDQVCQYLREHGIMVQLHYPIPLHLQPAYAHLGMRPGSLPVTEAFASRCMSLPCYPEMTPEQVRTVVETLKDALVRVSA
jgi:dTDP-4-amino-4,6-dideoxygalactose transaminase